MGTANDKLRAPIWANAGKPEALAGCVGVLFALALAVLFLTGHWWGISSAWRSSMVLLTTFALASRQALVFRRISHPRWAAYCAVVAVFSLAAGIVALAFALQEPLWY